MSDGDITAGRPGHAQPFSADEILEFDSRFTDHELAGMDLPPAQGKLADE